MVKAESLGKNDDALRQRFQTGGWLWTVWGGKHMLGPSRGSVLGCCGCR